MNADPRAIARSGVAGSRSAREAARSSIVVLGMHRSGTSCLAGMLAAAGMASAGEAIRNWDNARGHHEMLELVRLDEAVLAHSGGHYLSPPREVRFTAEHEAARDRLLATQVADHPALLKDPRMLLVLPFWRASSIAFRAVGIVRHPLAVARSLATWREMPLDEGISLWIAHANALVVDREAHGTPVLDFDQPKDSFVAEVAALFGCDESVLAAAYDEQLVHHDDGDAPVVARLDEAIALYRVLGGQGGASRGFPRAQFTAFERHLREGDRDAAIVAARAALEVVPDPAVVLVPAITALIRAAAHREATALLGACDDRGDGLPALLRAKVALAVGDAATAAGLLETACAVASPLYQARHLLPQALRAAGRNVEARRAQEQIALVALYPHGPLSTLAEWAYLDGDRDRALADMTRAIDAAPVHRRGRLRTRRAEWLRQADDIPAARRELELAVAEDPSYTRSRDLLATLR